MGTRARSLALGVATLALFAAPASAQHTETETVPPPPTGSTTIMVAAPPPQVTVVAPPIDTYTTSCPAGADCEIGSDGQMHVYQMEVQHRTDTGLLIAGAVMLGAGWALNLVGAGLASLLIAVAPGGDGTNFFCSSLIPIVGPIMSMFFAADQTWTIPILAVMDAVQITGLILAIVGQVGGDAEVRTEIGTLRLAPGGAQLLF